MCGSDLSVWRGAARSCRAFVGVGGAYFRSAHFTSVELYAPGAFGLETRSKTPPSNRHVRHNNTYKQLYARTTSAVRTTATGSPRGGACGENGGLSGIPLSRYHYSISHSRTGCQVGRHDAKFRIAYLPHRLSGCVVCILRYTVLRSRALHTHQERGRKEKVLPGTPHHSKRATCDAYSCGNEHDVESSSWKFSWPHTRFEVMRTLRSPAHKGHHVKATNRRLQCGSSRTV